MRTTPEQERPRLTSAILEALDSWPGRLNAILSLLTFLGGVLTQLNKLLSEHTWLSWPAFFLSIVFGRRLFLDIWQRKQRRILLNSTGFVGTRPLDEEDRELGRFHGRHDDVESLVNRITDSSIRWIALLGESGSGKTSLIRAGVIPEIRSKGKFHCIYLRFLNYPTLEIYNALRSAREGKSSAEDLTCLPADRCRHLLLLEELQETIRVLGKPVILFIDQFEEFQGQYLKPEEHQAVQEFIWCIIDRNAKIEGKLVFCIRYDYLHLLHQFEAPEHIDNIFSPDNRKYLELFSEETARQVILSLLDTSKLRWSPMLVDRIINDLLVRRTVGNSARNLVLPAELQIVCQMVISLNIESVLSYPGKQQLMPHYIESAIRSAPTDQVTAKKILLSLINENGFTRAQPQTVTEIAKHAGGLSERSVRRVLEFLDKYRYIVTTKPCIGSSSLTTYELSHDYLVRTISEVCGSELAGAALSRAVLANYHAQHVLRRGYRIPISDCIQLIRYRPETLKSDEAQALRRSIIQFLLIYCLTPFSLAIAALVIRYQTVVIRPGREFRDLPNVVPDYVITKGWYNLQPALGNNNPHIYIQLPTYVPHAHSWASRTCAFIKKSEWFWTTNLSMLGRLDLRWNKDTLLKHCLLQYADDCLKSNETFLSCYSQPHMALTLSMLDSITTERINSFRMELINKYKLATTCDSNLNLAMPSENNRECDRNMQSLKTIAINLYQLNGQSDRSTVDYLRKQLLLRKKLDANVLLTIELLAAQHAVDVEVLNWISGLSLSSDADNLASIMVNGQTIKINSELTLTQRIAETTSSESLIRILLPRFQQLSAQQGRLLEKDTLSYNQLIQSLIALKCRDRIFLDTILKGLQTKDGLAKQFLIDALIFLARSDQSARSELIALLENGLADHRQRNSSIYNLSSRHIGFRGSCNMVELGFAHAWAGIQKEESPPLDDQLRRVVWEIAGYAILAAKRASTEFRPDTSDELTGTFALLLKQKFPVNQIVDLCVIHDDPYCSDQAVKIYLLQAGLSSSGKPLLSLENRMRLTVDDFLTIGIPQHDRYFIEQYIYKQLGGSRKCIWAGRGIQVGMPIDKHILKNCEQESTFIFAQNYLVNIENEFQPNVIRMLDRLSEPEIYIYDNRLELERVKTALRLVLQRQIMNHPEEKSSLFSFVADIKQRMLNAEKFEVRAGLASLMLEVEQRFLNTD